VKQLLIETNHGFLLLGDVEVRDETSKCGRYHHKVARGTVLDGGETSRLFWATSHRPYPKGEVMEYTFWREAHCTDENQDHWRTSVVSCG
jgi:hypothetical protein